MGDLLKFTSMPVVGGALAKIRFPCIVQRCCISAGVTAAGQAGTVQPEGIKAVCESLFSGNRMRENGTSGSKRGKWKRSTAGLMRPLRSGQRKSRTDRAGKSATPLPNSTIP
jgi:hypothetical protein